MLFASLRIASNLRSCKFLAWQPISCLLLPWCRKHYYRDVVVRRY